MKCPYRTTKKTTPAPEDSGTRSLVVAHEFAECYGYECPYYSPEIRTANLFSPEACKRAQIEEKNARKERR